MTEQLVNIANAYLHGIKRAGPEEIMSICPFHRKADGSEERSGSFSMNVYSGLWYCHSCHARGNLYTFLRDIGVSRTDIKLKYQEALDEAGKYAPPTPDPMAPVEAVKEPLDESFLGNFDYCPQKMLDEGYPMELLRRFDIGFDFTHNRITFPIRDGKGRLIGISGRAQEDHVKPRYKLYDSEYLAFGLPYRKTERRPIIWNIHNIFTKLFFAEHPETQSIVVVEGYKAALRVAQAGVDNVCALMGSYLTQEQKWIFDKVTSCPLLLMLDNDPAGRKGLLDAALRFEGRYNLHIVHYNAKQPSDLTTVEVLEAVHTPELFTPWFLANS